MAPRTTISKVLLVASARASGAAERERSLRRYRIARLRLDGRKLSGASRLITPTRAYD